VTKIFEWRVGWGASSNCSFGGKSEWVTWDGPEKSEATVKDAIHRGGDTSAGLERALEESGFEWWVDVREGGMRTDAK
jgi:hypothetical protein